METTEVLFSTETSFDNKSILNKLNRPIDKSILDNIESGITLEDLNKITLSGVPVLKYKTQITIHGLFPELSNNYIFGYKNIFQNKNKSIGVKYNAIDEEKRQRIAKRLKNIGFHYCRNSQGTKFDIMEPINKDNFEEVKKRFLDLKNKIDISLFYGYCSIWVGEAWGCKYLCFDLYINAIYEKNIEPFLNKVGATVELYEAEQRKKEVEQAEYESKYKAERESNEAAKRASMASKSEQIQILEQYPRVEKTNEPGKYVLRSYNYDNELIFKVIHIYTVKGKQKPRWNYKEFITVQEALNYQPPENWSDKIYTGRLSGYKISN